MAAEKLDRPTLPAVVHLSAEFFPYARTGGLAEAVSGLASFQQRAGHRVVAMLPLYRSVRELAAGLVPAGDPFPVQVGPTTELAQLFRVIGAGPGPEVYAIAHPHFYDRPGIYGDSNGDYPDSARRFAFFVLAALEALPRFVSGPTILHAHDWHTALAPLYLKTTHAHRPSRARCAPCSPCTTPGTRATSPHRWSPRSGLPWETYTHHCLEWYGRANMLKGGLTTANLVVTVSAKHAEELRTDEGGFGLQEVFQALGPRLVGITNGIDQSVWDPCHRQAHHGEVQFARPRRQGALQGSAAACLRPAPAQAHPDLRVCRAPGAAEGARRDLRELPPAQLRRAVRVPGRGREALRRCPAGAASRAAGKGRCRDRPSATGWSTVSWRVPTCSSCHRCMNRAA